MHDAVEAVAAGETDVAGVAGGGEHAGRDQGGQALWRKGGVGWKSCCDGGGGGVVGQE